jgi:hypothetical protein
MCNNAHQLIDLLAQVEVAGKLIQCDAQVKGAGATSFLYHEAIT